MIRPERPAKPKCHTIAFAQYRLPLSPEIGIVRMVGGIASGLAKMRDYGQTRLI